MVRPGAPPRHQKFTARRDTEGWQGTLSVNPRGFGFVASVGKDDVFIPPENLGAALHGDTVQVTVTGRSNRGTEGRIESVVSRRNPRVAGTLRRRGRSAWLEPDDTRLRGPIVLGREVKDGKDGDAAVATITRWPTAIDENPEGDLVLVLGPPGDPQVEVAKILVREGVEEGHPEAALAEAERFTQRSRKHLAQGRVDLRDVPLPTIDPEDARDHDDAVWVERRGEGFRAWIAIADVSEYVQPGTALDEEARRRGCTIYLPDRAIPMLPSALAADLCSLLAEQERLTLCVIADLDKNGKPTSYEIVEGVMRSAAMLTYGGVARALGFTELPQRSPAAETFKRDLKVLDDLARKLRRQRLRRGALDLDLPEPKIELDPETGAPVAVTRRAQDPGVKRAYQMIEELMLLANELVAQWLGRQRSPAVYRVHAKPDEAKLERLGEVAQIMAVPFDSADVAEPGGVGRFLESIAEHPKKNVLEMLLLRSLKQAQYDIGNIGHYGLASEAYLHFTSPIRRYPDLLVHRLVKHLLRGGKVDASANAVEALRNAATTSSQRERAAMDVEREVVDLYRALHLRDRVGDTFTGTVTALVGSGAYVALDDPYCDVLVRFESMGSDRYELSDDELAVVGVRSGDTIALGDRMVVVIEDVALLRRTVFARRVPPEGAAAGESRGRGKRGPLGRPAQRGGPAPRGGKPDGRRAQSKPAFGAGKPGGGERGRPGRSTPGAAASGGPKASGSPAKSPRWAERRGKKRR